MRFLARLLFLCALLPAPAFAYTILVVGDSLSAAYGMNEAEGWVALLEERLGEATDELEVVNASISGDTSGGGIRRIDDALARAEPDLVILELGGNDGLRGNSLEAMQENLIGMSERAMDAGAEVLILGMQIPPNYGPAYTERFREAFAAAADETGADLLPFFLEPIAMDRAAFQRDGIHPSAESQPALMEHVLPAVEAIMERDTAETM